MFRGVLASRASEGQGGGSAQGLNRMGGLSDRNTSEERAWVIGVGHEAGVARCAP